MGRGVGKRAITSTSGANNVGSTPNFCAAISISGSELSSSHICQFCIGSGSCAICALKEMGGEQLVLHVRDELSATQTLV
ncbi:hypothetical protein D3C81_1930430 [compost metagenome]